jgi:MATE family multidrug resistance protein
MLFLRVFNDDDDEKKKRKQQKVMMKLHQTRGEKRGVFVSSHRGGVLGGVLGGKKSKRKKAAEMTERTMTSYYDRSSRGGFRPEDFSSVDEDDEEEEDKEKQRRRRRRRRQSGESASTTSSSTSSSSSAFTNFSMKMILDGEETKEIFTLAVPALGALLADPLMSLIDTMFVGRIGVNELTALGPNAAIFQVIYKIRRSVSISLFFSVAFGMVSLVALNCFASDILRLVGTPESLLATAAPYLRIRAFATPFVLASYCAQGAFIGKLDSKTPLRIFAFAAVLNVFGDFLLVPSYGLRGAAFATLFAQCASAVLFSSQLFGQKMLPKIGSPEWKSPPTATEIQRITKVSSALFFSSICRMGVYTMMTTTALHLGNAVMAAHQIALNVFWSLTYFVDPLFVASTSFIARDFERDAEKAKTIAKKLLLLSFAVGVFISIVAFLVSAFASGAFTTDFYVQSLVRSVSVYMLVSQCVSAVVFVSEGILIGAGDARYLLRAHLLNFLALAVVLRGVGHFSLGLRGIWFAVLTNQIFRLMQHAIRTMFDKNGPDIFLLNGNGKDCGVGDAADPADEDDSAEVDVRATPTPTT